MTLTLFCYVTLTSHDLETTPKQLAGHILVIDATLYLIVHHLVQMLCTYLECLCWMATMLDLCDNWVFAMEEMMGIFNCGHSQGAINSKNEIVQHILHKRFDLSRW